MGKLIALDPKINEELYYNSILDYAHNYIHELIRLFIVPPFSLCINGPWGSGKTTLMNILYGLYQPDGGEIYIRGVRAAIQSPSDAIQLGIGMVHQHFKLINTHTAAENIALVLKSKTTNILDQVLNLFKNPLVEAEEEINKLSHRYGLKVNPYSKIWQLSVGEQQRVEIIKALYQGVDVLILDEPTSVLTPAESDELFSTLRKMVEKGHAIIFISHKLDEVIKVSDRITLSSRFCF